MVKIGDKIKILGMKDEPHYEGKTGIVEHIDDMGQLHGTWGGLAVIPEEDHFEVIQKSCVICKKLINGHGNNPMPLRGDTCCDECNLQVVIPLRLFWDGSNQKQAMILGEDNSIQFIKPQKKYFQLEQLQGAVRGYVEAHPVNIPRHVLYVNEEGLLKSMKPNRLAELAFDVKVVGPALVCPVHLLEE